MYLPAERLVLDDRDKEDNVDNENSYYLHGYMLRTEGSMMVSPYGYGLTHNMAGHMSQQIFPDCDVGVEQYTLQWRVF